MNSRTDTAPSSALTRLLRSPLLQPFNDVAALRELVSAINPMWALGQVRARVIEVADESADVRSFVLQPNRAWRGYRAGQHVLVEVEINGVRRQRTFSISSTPGPRRRGAFTLTIKRHAAGGVTDWMHRQLAVGAVLRLSQALGSFNAPALAADEELLLISAGSGITPAISVLRQTLAAGHAAAVHFLHICRSSQDALFANELDTLAQTFTQLRLTRWIGAEQGRFDTAALTRLLPQATTLRTLLCGPTELMQSIAAHYAAHGALARLQFEDFNGAMHKTRHGDGRVHQVSGLAAGHSSFAAPGTTPLLQAAEAAGLKPAYGCRIGICKTCQCTKLSGTVENLRTGAISSQPGERIQLCVSVARSDLELAP